jgi:hypothetical protein
MQQHTATEITANPHHHIQIMSARLSQIIDELRQDIEVVQEPQFRAMFETSAEVLTGLVTAFRHYEQKAEVAWDHAAQTLR